MRFNLSLRNSPGLSWPGRSLAAALLAAVLGLAGRGSAHAQGTAVLSGSVIDALGRGIPGAVVTVVSEISPDQPDAVAADARGQYRIRLRHTGRIEVVAEAAGFAAARRTVDVEHGSQVALRLSLDVAAITEAVHVRPGRLAGTPEAVLRIPGAVDIIDRATLDASRVLSTNEALRKAPGVVVRDEEGLGLRPNIGIRGTNPTRSSRVLLLEDGLLLTYAPYGDNATYYHPPIERFETVEVLKGSGQIAYGPMTVGGVINYVTPDPPASQSGSASLTVGTRASLHGHANYGTTVGRAGLRVDYLRRQGNGAREHTSTVVDDTSAKTTLTLSATQRLVLRGSYYAETSTLTYSGLQEAEFRDNPRGNPFANDEFVVDRGAGALTHQWTPRGSFVLSTAAYAARVDRDWWRQSSTSTQRPNDAADPACGGMANLLTTCGNEGRLRAYWTRGVETRAHVAHRWGAFGIETTAGARLHGERQERQQRNGATPVARDGRLVEDNQRLNTAWAMFVQQRLQHGAWSLTPGLRLEHVGYGRTNRLNGASGTTRLTALIPGLGIAHAPTDRLTWFAGLHRGFAPPRTEDVISNMTGGSIDLDPELSWNTEFGARTELRPGLKADVTLFRMDYRNQVVPATVAGGAGATVTSAGATEHAGVEGALRVEGGPLAGLRANPYLRASITWLPVARFAGPRMSTVPGFGDETVTGRRLPYAPALAATITGGVSIGPHWDVLVEAVHQGRQFGDDLNSVTPSADGQRGVLPASTLWHAAANWRLPGSRATIFITVKNLRDTLVIVDRSRGLLPGMPRMIHAGVTARF